MTNLGKQRRARRACVVVATCVTILTARTCVKPSSTMARSVGRPALQASQRDAGPTSEPASLTWASSKGIKIKYLPDWQPRKNPDFELMLIPVGATTDRRRITIDVPDLPPHLPFMIQMSRVERGYIEDLKKEHPDLKVNDAADAHVPESKARLIRSIWHRENQKFNDMALLVIHDSSVYILDAQTDETNLPPTRAAFDFIRSSIAWTKH